MVSPETSVSKKSFRDEDPIVRASSTFKPATYGDRFQRPSETDESMQKVVEREWSIDLHEGVPSLTVKALIAGSLVGVLCSFLALYYGLKTGVVPSLNILSGLGGFLLVRAFLRVKIFRGVFTPQENAVIQTVAVACYAVSSVGIGFSSGYLAVSYNAYVDMGGSAFPGNREEDTFQLTWSRNLLWCFSLSFFGFFLAFPLRDYVILKQRLPFPSGTITAYVIKSMHNKAAKTAQSFAVLSKFFSLGFCVGMFTWVYNGLSSFPIFGAHALAMYSWSVDFDVGSFGIGAILSPQVNGSMLLGAILSYGILQPFIATYQNGPGKWVDLDNLPGNSSFLGLQAYNIFAGLAVMIITGAFTIVVLIWTLTKDYLEKKRQRANGETVEVEEAAAPHRMQTVVLTEKFRSSRIPVWVPYLGYIVFSAITVVVLHVQFKVHGYQTLIAIAIIPVFAISNIQGIGRTDWDVSSSYGKLMMFPFGAWNHNSSILPSLALCNVTISGCSNAGTLLQDFKTGYLVGASPNSMFLAQIFGALVGCFVTPTLFALLSSTFVLPNTQDATAFLQGRYGTIYRTLAVVATGSGFENVLWIAFGFGLFAIICLCLESFLPSKYAVWVPNASGMSIGILVQPAVSIEFCLGGAIVLWWTRWSSTAASKVPYIAAGCVAGSGISVVCRCLLSLIDIKEPVTVHYLDGGQILHAAQWFGAAVFLAIFFAVFACGAWYWNQCDLEPAEDLCLEEQKQEYTKSRLAKEQSSFRKSEDTNEPYLRKE